MITNPIQNFLRTSCRNFYLPLFLLLVISCINDSYSQDGLWLENGKFISSGTEKPYQYGVSTTISDSFLFVGTWNDKVYAYERVDTGWAFAQEIFLDTSSTITNNYFRFGSVVACENGTLVVGSESSSFDSNGTYIQGLGRADVFERIGGIWTHITRLQPNSNYKLAHFGKRGLAISGDYIMVSSNPDNFVEDTLYSRVTIFKKTNGSWTESQTIVNPVPQFKDYFGYSIDINDSVAIIGAPRQNISTNTEQGAAHIYRRVDSLWVFENTLIDSNGTASNWFGRSVAIEGNRTVVGQHKRNKTAASMHLYRKNAGIWSLSEKITGNGYKGYASRVELEGDLILVSSDIYDRGLPTGSNEGICYIYSITDTTIAFNQIIYASDGPKNTLGGFFGYSVDFHNQNIVVGAVGKYYFWNDSIWVSNAGGIYTFLNVIPNKIQGSIFTDNGNCVQEPGSDIYLPNYAVSATRKSDGTIYYGSSDSSGFYKILTDSGTYVVQQILPVIGNLISQSCPDSTYSVQFDTLDQLSTGHDFVDKIEPCPFLTVDIASNRRRWCASGKTVVAYSNIGFADAVDVNLNVEFPEYVSLSSADHTYILDSNGFYIFHLDTVKVGASGTINIIDQVSCEPNIVDLTQCTKAWISPVNQCADDLDTTTGTSAGWDKSSILVEGYCIRDSIIEFLIINTGEPTNGDMQGSSTYRIYADNSLSYSDTFQLNGGDTFHLQVPNVGGQTIRLEADQRPGHPGKSRPRITIEGCGTNGSGTFTTGLVNSVEMDDLNTQVAEYCSKIVYSYDPNDKQISPSGITANKYVKPLEPLDFMIRFQNTGSDTAYKVVVVDTLSEFLDLSTLKQGAASHPYKFELSGKNLPVITFLFESINLPGQSQDELASQGFINFTITPKAGIPLKTEIHNTANIYFDANLPIQTADVWVTLFDTTIMGSAIHVLDCDSTVPPPLSMLFSDTTICANHSIQLLVNADTSSTFHWVQGTGMNSYYHHAPTINPIISQTYKLEVSDTNTCYISLDSVVVEVNPLINSINLNDTTICAGDSIALTVLDTGSYTWDQGVIDGEPFSPAASTVYHLLDPRIDVNGCPERDSVSILVMSNPNVQGTAKKVTLISSNPLTYEGCEKAFCYVYGSGANSYSWEPSQILNSTYFKLDTTRTYVVTGTNSFGCTAKDTLEIIVHPRPDVGINVMDTSVCQGDSILLYGTGASSYYWINGHMDSTYAFPVATTNYIVIGTDVYGCKANDTTTVTLIPTPVVNITASDTLICKETSVVLTGIGADSLIWDHPIENSVGFIPDSTDLYTITGITPEGCAGTKSVQVTVLNLPQVSGYSTDSVICSGQSITLSGLGAYSYTWTNGITNNLPFVPDSVFSFSVLGTDTNGCQNVDSVSVTLLPLPEVLANSNHPKDTVCAGDSIILFGSGTLTYSWNNGVIDNNPFVPAVTPPVQTYTVTGTDSNGCQNTDSISIVLFDVHPVALFENSISDLTITFVDSSQNTSSWFWTFDSLITNTNQYWTHSVSERGIYNVCLRSSNQCFSDTLCQLITVGNVGITHHLKHGNIILYPNPAKDFIQLELDYALQNGVFQLTDVLGRTVLLAPIEVNHPSFNVSTLEKGIYLYRILENGTIIGMGKIHVSP